MRFRPSEVHIFFIRITNRFDLAMFACLSVRPYERLDIGNHKSFLRSASLFHRGAKPTQSASNAQKSLSRLNLSVTHITIY